MKIIGKSDNGYIIEASADDVANLIGYYSKYEDKAKLSVGDKINISRMYQQLYSLERNQPKLKDIVGTLRNLADLLEPVCPVIEKSLKEATKEMTEPSVVIKKGRKGTTIEFKNINIKPEELHKIVEESRRKSNPLCIRCGKKSVYHPDSSYCKGCEDSIDNGPVQKFIQAGGTAEELRKLAKEADHNA